MAAPLSDPKLMAEMFTMESGRNARARPRAPPSTLAAGSGRAGSGRWGSPAGAATGKAACFTIR
jgi:hypothetical protein